MVESKNSSRGKTTFNKDWTKGSIIHNLLLLSYPIIIHSELWTVTLIIEMICVGRLGAASIAGVGVAGFVYMLVLMVKTGLSMGERAMVARFIGAGDVAAANHVSGQAFIISAAFGVVGGAIGVLFTEPILSLFNLEVDALSEGVAYLRIVLGGVVLESFWVTTFTVMQASGDSVTPMKIAIFVRIIHAVLYPFLVLGWWVFPRLGVSGAAITYIIVMGVGVSISLWILFSGQTRLRLTLRNFRPDLKILWRILKIGIPGSGMGLARTFGDLVLTWLMTPFGTLAVAAHSLTNRIEMFIRMPGNGLGMGAGVLVGQNLGAGQAKRAVRSSWLALGLGEGFMVICSVVLLIWTENIISIFNIEPDMVKLGSIFLRIATAGYLVMYFVYILQNCISGAGDTLPSMIITLLMVWVVQLPFSFLLSRYTDMGMYGVRWSIVISFVVGAAAFTIYFWQGRWKRKKV